MKLWWTSRVAVAIPEASGPDDLKHVPAGTVFKRGHSPPGCGGGIVRVLTEPELSLGKMKQQYTVQTGVDEVSQSYRTHVGIMLRWYQGRVQ